MRKTLMFFLALVLVCGCGAALVLLLLVLLIFVLIYRNGVPARCMPPEETLNIWGAFF